MLDHMHHRIRSLMTIIAIVSLATISVRAQQESSTAPSSTQESDAAGARASRKDKDASKEKDEEKPVTTEHELTIDGRPLKYKATAGQLPLKDDSGKTRAKVFFIYYERIDVGDAADRPVAFVFNGGPGAASVWLHLGTAGPKKVHLPEDGAPPAPPFRLEDNPYTWLSFTDLCFIDPVGTGFSRATEAEKAREFYGVTNDINSVADFIRIFCTKYARWPSPKFLAGESYGTTRAAGLSEYLHDRYGTDLNGIVLISTVLNFQTLQPSAGNDLPYALYLPTYTACAWFHNKLPARLQGDVRKAVAEAEAWAMGDYLTALAKGTALDDAARDELCKKLAEYSGLSLDYVRKSNLKINPARFEKSLLADQRKVIGRMDGRITGFDVDPLNDTPEFDPSMSGYMGLFSATFNDYVRRELKYESETTYEILSPRVGPWDFGTAGQGYLNVATTLRQAMTKSPSLKIMVASGLFDLATPLAGADYTVNQMPLNKELRANISQKYYEGGHMLYLNRPALVQLHADLKAFFESALPKK
jgi:carboxypeptidase C (cathepsin A)